MRKRRRVVAAVGAIGAVALAVGIIIGAETPGSSSGASQPSSSSGATTVQSRTLVSTDTESGTLSYADPQTVFNRLSGTITWLPSIGQVIKPGQTLYKVDGAPVVLFSGAVPAYRDLSAGVSDGADVQELKQNLVALGFDPEHQITINQTFDAATTAAVDRWQASLGQTQTGTVSLGQVVFLPGSQRITAVNTVLGSTGGASSGSGSGSGSGGGSSASTTVTPPRAEFVSLTTTSSTPSSTRPTSTQPTSTTPAATSPPACKGSGGQSSTGSTGSRARTPSDSGKRTRQQPSGCRPGGSGSRTSQGSSPSSLAALLALLKAETLELQHSRSSAGGSGAAGSGAGGSGAGGSGAGGGGSRAGGAAVGSAAGSGRGGAGGGGGGSGGGGGGGSAASGAGSGASSGSGTGSGSPSGSGSGAAQAQSILSTTSTQVVVTVDLDATKQTEAVTGEPVTVQLPSGGTVAGKITAVSPVAQSSSSSSGSSGSGVSGGSGGSSTPSATIPVTITLTGHQHVTGLDQAAVSVNFQQEVAKNVLSVPVTALLATAGGGYAVQEAAAPHRLIPVTPGLFAAGYVEISGPGVFSGLEVTDSQG